MIPQAKRRPPPKSGDSPSISEQRTRILRYLTMDPEERIKYRAASGLRFVDVFAVQPPMVEQPLSLPHAEATLDKMFTAREILQEAKRQGIPVSQSSFYRNFGPSLDRIFPHGLCASWPTTARMLESLRTTQRQLNEWKSVEQLADVLGICVDVAQRKLFAGAYPAKKVGGGILRAPQWRVPPDVFDRIVLQTRVIRTMLDTWETPGELAQRLGLTSPIVYKLIEQGKIPVRKVPAIRNEDGHEAVYRIYPGFSKALDRQAFLAELVGLPLTQAPNATPESAPSNIRKMRRQGENEILRAWAEDADRMEQQRKEIIGQLVSHSKAAERVDLDGYLKHRMDELDPRRLEATEVSLRVAAKAIGLNPDVMETKCRTGEVPGARKIHRQHWNIPVAWLNEQHRIRQTRLDTTEFLWACEQAGIPVTRRVYYDDIVPQGVRYINHELLFSFELFVDLLKEHRAEEKRRQKALTLVQLAARIGRSYSATHALVRKHRFHVETGRGPSRRTAFYVPRSEAYRLIRGLREERYSVGRAARHFRKEELKRRNLAQDVSAAVRRLEIGRKNFRGRVIVPPEEYGRILQLIRQWKVQQTLREETKCKRQSFAELARMIEFTPDEIQTLVSKLYKDATDNEAERLWILAKQGNNKAFERIAQGLMRFIQYAASQYYTEIPMSNKIQFGLWGLFQAVSNWYALPDASKRQMNAYAKAYIRGAILNECRKDILPRGKASVSLLKAMELGMDESEGMSGRGDGSIEMSPGITFTPSREE